MMNCTFNRNQYTGNNVKLLDKGDYRVRINSVTFKESKDGNSGLEIKLDVNGKAQKLFCCIWFDERNEQIINQRLNEFYNSFNIKPGERDNIDSWVGKFGAVRVKHIECESRTLAKVSFCLDRKYQEKLPKWKDRPTIKYNDKREWYEDLPSASSLSFLKQC